MLSNLIQKFGITKNIFLTTFITLALLIYFLFYTIFGSKGIVSYFALKNELQNKELIKNELQNKLQNKQNLVDGMSLKSLDIDLLDEQARKNLGYASKGELVIYEEETDKTHLAQ